MKNTSPGIPLAGLLSVPLIACLAAASVSALVAEEMQPAYRDSRLPVEARVKDLLSRMTVEEKIGQLQSQFINDKTKLDEKQQPRDPNVGFIVNYARAKPGEADQIAVQNNAEMKQTIEGHRLGIPVFIHTEGHHGVTTVPASLFPTSFALAGAFDLDLAGRVYAAIADEAKAMNIRHLLSPPVPNLVRDPRWGRTEETFGEDVFLTSRMAVAAARPFSERGVVTSTKHFVANYGDGGRDSASVYFSDRELREYWLAPFEAAIVEGGSLGLMPSYNSVNGIPMHANSHLLNDVLRGEWGFQGIVTSDYGDHGKGLTHLHRITANPVEGAARVVRSGVDVSLPNGMEHLPEAVRTGALPMQDLDGAVERVLRVKFLAGLFDEPYADPAVAAKVVRSPEHVTLALEAARKSIVLLKNEKNILPLSKSARIGVAGPAAATFFAGGYGRYTLPTDVPPWRGLQERVGKEGRLSLFDGTGDLTTWANAQDVIVFFATIAEGEGSDRANLDLPVFTGAKKPKAIESEHTILVEQAESEVKAGDQQATILQLAATGKPVVVVLVTGAPVTMQKWLPKVAAVVQMGYLGEQGGLAIADVLFGDVNPGGKLPMTFPRSVNQVPLVYSEAPSGRSGRYWDDDAKPQFPFGFGLSYTTFRLSNLKLASDVTQKGAGEVKVSVDVTNTGSVGGDEVVQIYLRDDVSSVVQPKLRLKAFRRVTVPPGETETVVLSIPAAELRIWNDRMERVIEPGSFTVRAGTSAADLPLEAKFVVK